MTADQLKANAEYYRKLNQQLIQKDNIIKLLQLKLKNLETNLSREGGTVSELPADDEGDRGKGKPGRRARADRDAAAAATDDRAREIASRLTDLERANERLTADLAQAREEVATREATIAELGRERTDRAAGPGLDPSPHLRELERLRGQLADRNREIEKLSDQLDRHKTDERWPASASDPVLKDELAAAERSLAGTRAENARLKAQVEALLARPEPDLRAAISGAGGEALHDSLELMQLVIGLLQRANDLEPHLPSDAEAPTKAFRNHLAELAKSAGIERIKTIGATFDPKLHQAVEMVYSSEHPHSTVLKEISPGFSAQGVVVRLSDVVVSLNPYYCTTCEKVAVEGSRFCHVCGARVLGREKEGVRILDEKATCLSQIELGSSHEVAGNLSMASVHYTKALALDPKHPRALTGMARVSEQEGRYDESLRYLDQVLPFDPDSEDLNRSRERILVKLEILNKLRSLT
jgi:molecular chaperone GrpE